MAGKAQAMEDVLGLAKDVTSRGRKLREPSPLDMLANTKLAEEIRELRRLGPKMSDDFYNAERARILAEMQKNTYVVDPRFVNAKGQPTPFNLAPDASMRTYLMPDGSIVRRPAGQPAPRGAQPLNKTPEQLETLLPPARGTPAPAAPAAPAMSAEDAAIAAAREANEAARASRAAESTTAAETAAALESRASAMNPPAPPPRPAPGPDVTAASPAEQTFRAGQPTREAVQSNAPRNVALGAAGVAVPAGMIRDNIPIPTYEPLQGYGQRYADWKAMQVPQDYVGDAGFDVGPSPDRPSPWDETNVGAPEPVSSYFPRGRVPDILAPVAGGGADRAVQTARSVGTRSTPTQIATAAADNPTGGFFSRLSNAIYDPNYQKGMSSKQMFEQMQRDPRGELSFAQEESPAAYARAAQRAREEGEGRASGGKAGNGVPKDAALHKALEIIHRLISR